MCGGVRSQVGGGVWFPHGNCVCGVCVREWCGLRIELEDEIGCSIVGALVGGQCVGELGCVRMYVFAEWSGERWGRSGTTPTLAGSGLRVHPLWRGAPDRCLPNCCGIPWLTVCFSSGEAGDSKWEVDLLGQMS